MSAKVKKPWTPDALAEALDVTGETVRAEIRRGKIVALKIGRQYRIPAAEARRVLTPASLLTQEPKDSTP